MKWGVRKDKGHEGEAVKTKKLGKLDKKWDRDLSSMKGYVKLNNAVADSLNGPGGRFAKVNAKPAYKGKNLLDPKNKKLYGSYLNDIASATTAAHREVAKSIGSNPSGTRKLGVDVHPVTKEATFKFEGVKHADIEDDITYVGTLDDNGFITGIKLLSDDGTMAQSDAVDNFLEHFGVIGMKWGQRKALKNKTSADAKASIDIRNTAKKASPKALTNKQLITAINRMNLEQGYKRLAVNEKSGASRWVSSMLMEIGKKEVQALVAKKVASSVARTVATGGLG
jgi:hypothetical protein